ncbi:VOC family protein [Anaeromyxobacter oryzisoli]|uniref:VOC family protein n=1 Tax=Anaeromyxobacter oryzisoli TaxID=2925408 RepID=UPI001F59A202|nr:VOC family protein [Anaeromyxobacter sp. SG63]
MIERIDHVAVAVRNGAAAQKRLEDVFGARLLVEQVNSKGRYRVRIFRLGDDLVSVLEATSPESFVAKHIEKFGEGVQHIGVEVDSLDQALKRFDETGTRYAAFEEISGVRKEVLVSARNGFGVILQVMEWLGEYKHASPEERMRKAWGTA